MDTIIVLLITCGFTYLSAFVDHEHLLDNDFIESHTSRWLLRASFISIIAVYDVFLACAAGLLFTSTFDQTLNLLRGESLFHLGSTSRWDLFWKKRLPLYIGMKVLALAISIIIAIWTII